MNAEPTLMRELRKRGYRVELWPVPGSVWTEITDLATAATVYVPESSTLDEALTAINKKNEQFERAKKI